MRRGATVRLVAEGLTAEILGLSRGVMLTLRDGRGHVIRRRRKRCLEDARDEFWEVAGAKR